jgi:hypothetical protein
MGLFRDRSDAVKRLIGTDVYGAVEEVRESARVHGEAMDRIAASVELVAAGVLAYIVWLMLSD